MRQSGHVARHRRSIAGARFEEKPAQRSWSRNAGKLLVADGKEHVLFKGNYVRTVVSMVGSHQYATSVGGHTKAAGNSGGADMKRLALPLAAVFVVSLGYGVVLPVLPFVLADAIGVAERARISWHTGMLTGVYMLALFLFAPLWGYISDRIGRRTVILIGLAGFSVAMVLFALAPDLVLIYSARALAGVFAVAVLPVVLALVGEMSTSRTRSQAFAWLSATSALGFMFGSMLSGLLASVTMVSTTVALMLPFYVAAGLSGLVWLAAYRFLPDSASRLGIKKESQRNAQSLLLVLSLLVMLGLGSYEVGMALLGQQVLSLQPREIGWMFIECSLVMILVQVFLLTPLIQRVGSNLLAPALMVMAVGIALLPYATSLPMMMMGIGLIAAASGLLITALTYLISLAAGSASGAALGKQTAAGSLGYAVGSSAAGWLFAVHIAIPFWITAGLLCLGAFAAFRASNNLKSIVRVEFNLKSERA